MEGYFMNYDLVFLFKCQIFVVFNFINFGKITFQCFWFRQQFDLIFSKGTIFLIFSKKEKKSQGSFNGSCELLVDILFTQR